MNFLLFRSLVWTKSREWVKKIWKNSWLRETGCEWKKCVQYFNYFPLCYLCFLIVSCISLLSVYSYYHCVYVDWLMYKRIEGSFFLPVRNYSWVWCGIACMFDDMNEEQEDLYSSYDFLVAVLWMSVSFTISWAILFLFNRRVVPLSTTKKKNREKERAKIYSMMSLWKHHHKFLGMTKKK